MVSAADPTETPVALTIATSDSGGGAGVQADLKTFASLGAFGTSVFCALTAQNPREVRGIAALEPAFIRQQFEAVFGYFAVRAAKTGMLFSAGIIETVAEALAQHPAIPVVVDPVMVATSGAILLQPDAIDVFARKLLPRAQLITPNLDEAAVLLGTARPTTVAGMSDAARALADRFGTTILLKGGHLEGSANVPDLLCAPGEAHPFVFEHPRIEGVNTHGSGCTLSAAITAGLACGHPLGVAVERALGYIESALRTPLPLNGEQFLRH